MADAAIAQEVTIRSQNDITISIPINEALRQAAMRWSYKVQNRERWASRSDNRAEMAQMSEAQFADLGVNTADVARLAGAVQVSIPFTQEDVAWEARIFPWEYLLAAATSRNRIGRLAIVRHLRTATHRKPRTGPLKSGLIIESAPGPLRRRYNFDSERVTVSANLEGVTFEGMLDPTRSQLFDHVAQRKPDVIHLAGFDSHQGAALLGVDDPGRDGYLAIDDEGRGPSFIESIDLAQALNAGRHPRFVGCNFHNSGARVAALIVAAGTDAAIGFQDYIDDAVGELFFALFYRNWSRNGWDVYDAFDKTLEILAQRPGDLKGAGIVLWLAHDIFATGTIGRTATPTAQPTIVSTAESTPEPAGAARPAPRLPARQLIDVDARPKPRINYSLLHNDQDLFDSFLIRNLTTGTVAGIDVEVVLYVGESSFPYRRTLDLSQPNIPLADKIRVPLTSAMLRGVRESMRSVIYVRVRCQGETVYEDTTKVALVPVEEWSSATGDDVWLPSFVLPRDPAVPQIVAAARAFLNALRDNARAGFDGYQAVNPVARDPYVKVDQQAQALWSALSFEYDLTYLNPPPSYAAQTQRLRSPSEVVATRSGTCIDLALLMAATLEYVGIHPVILLLAGHSFPGYWRSEQFAEDFEKVGMPVVAPGGIPSVDPTQTVVRSEAAGGAWYVRKVADTNDPIYEEILGRVRRRELVVMETVEIANGGGFEAAKRNAIDKLNDPQAFRGLVDIRVARRHQITPLPLG